MAEYSQFTNFLVEKADKVATLTFNRPERLNAIDPATHTQFEDLMLEIDADDEVNAIVLTGAGRAFCAGGDVKAMNDQGGGFGGVTRNPTRGGRNLVMNMLEVRQPIIAALNGDAVGLGATIALFCDVIIASETARIGDPHVRVGIVAGDGGAIIWPALIGPAKAKEYLMTGDLIPAPEAERIGLINKVVPRDEVMESAMAMARRLADGPGMAIQWTKYSVNKALRAQVNLSLDTSLALEALTFASEDHKEAARSFVEKRPPRFTGR
jgi:enoyl-CoA hydratase